MLENTIRDEQAQKILQSFLGEIDYYYTFDVTTGIVEKDIIDKNGCNYMKEMDVVTPCLFDELIEKSFNHSALKVQFIAGTKEKKLSTDYFRKCFASGKRSVETYVYYPNQNVYHRLNYVLIEDAENHHIMAYVFAKNITDIEEKKERYILNTQQELEETDSIIASAQIGIWHIFLFENELPRMRASAKMKELLGIEKQLLSEEDIYEAWYGRVKPSSLPFVNEAVDKIISDGFGEVTYKWSHPTRGEIYVRCGGTSKYVEGKGYILRGYHSDVTSIVTAENQQKQLLAEALNESNRRKELLQKALDNYKQADNDRRTDFLTGLGSRQDMDEVLNSQSQSDTNIQSAYLLDIDNFKLYNDTYGHIEGDQCLRKISQALSQYGKENHVKFYRYGGEEILALNASIAKSAQTVAEEIIEVVRNLNIYRGDTPLKYVSVSLGYTCDTSDYAKMIDKADQAMYCAKQSGKNCIKCFEDLE